MPGVISFDDSADYFSSIPVNYEVLGGKQTYLKDLITSSRNMAMRLFRQLSFIDYEIIRLYYFEGLTQQQISSLLDVTQGAVSKRLANVFKRLKLLLKMPKTSPVEVREDFRKLFDDDLFDIAYFFYFEPVQNRVKFFIDTSQSGASNKFRQIIAYLEKVKEREVEGLSLAELDRQQMAISYYDFFKDTKERALQWLFLYKGNGKPRLNAIQQGDSIFDAEKRNQ